MMEGPHTFEMVANQSYTRRKKLEASHSPRREAVVTNPTPVASKLTSASNSSTKETSKVNKLAVAGVLTVFLVLVLAVSSMVIAVMTYINAKAIQTERDELQQIGPDIVTEMQAQIAELTQDLTAAQSQLVGIRSNVQVIVGKMHDTLCIATN